MRLTLMEEVLLLGIKDREVSIKKFCAQKCVINFGWRV